MASVTLVPNRQHSLEAFMKAFKYDRKKFQPGSVLEIITEEQRINSGNQQQKVVFVFQSWCVQCFPTSEHIIGMSGERLVGESLVGVSRVIGRKRQRPEKPVVDICWLSTQNLQPGDIRARTITYYDNIVSLFLPSMPIVLTRLIWQYTQG